jgi:hypothetical protein
MPKLLYADLSSENCSAELWLNDIPIAQVTEAASYLSVAAAMYVVDGVNNMEVIVNPGPEPARARDRNPQTPAENATVAARLTGLDPGQFTDDPNAPVLMRVDWTRDPAVTVGPFTANGSANLGSMFGAWAWQSAPPLQLDAATIASVTEVLERVRTSLQQGDPAVLGRLARPKFEAAAFAFPARSLAETLRQFSAVVARNAATPGWTMAPLDPAQFSFRLAAGGRLIECINKDWRATLRATSESRTLPYYFPMFLGYYGNEFAIYL